MVKPVPIISAYLGGKPIQVDLDKLIIQLTVFIEDGEARANIVIDENEGCYDVIERETAILVLYDLFRRKLGKLKETYHGSKD